MYSAVSVGCGTVFFMIGLLFNTPYQIFGVIFPFILYALTIIQMFVMKKIANKFIEETGPNAGFNEYIQYPKTIISASISTVIILTLIIISLTVFSSGVDIFDYQGLSFILLDQGWEIMNYLALPFFHVATITLGGFGMSKHEESENR
ncbi:MAG: hypothetical protein ACTSVL_11220 [Promethearchaeota archaeon]